MANDALTATYLYLYPGRFGGPIVPSTHKNPTASDIHNVAVPAFQVGSRITIRLEGTSTNVGWSEFTYLKAGTPDATAVAAGTLCVPLSTTDLHTVSNDPATVRLNTGLAAYALSAMTEGRYGFYWTGGYQPKELVSGFPTTLLTDGTVAADKLVKVVSTGGICGLGLDTLSGDAADSFLAIGYSASDDA